MAKILIADDSRIQVHLFASRLSDMGFEIVVAVDAVQAWMTALRAAPDAIVLDINMPGGSGIDVLRKLKLSTKTMHIPVVVVSGSNKPEVQGVVMGMGVKAYLQKPVNPDQLGNLLIELLGLPTGIVPEAKMHPLNHTVR